MANDMAFTYDQALDLAVETVLAAAQEDQIGQVAATLPLEDHRAHDLLITALVDLVTALASMRADDIMDNWPTNKGRLPDAEATIHVAALLVRATRADEDP